MARERPDVWNYGHPLPIEGAPAGDGRRARCLTCGPVRPDAEGAVRALQDLASREKIGA